MWEGEGERERERERGRETEKERDRERERQRERERDRDRDLKDSKVVYLNHIIKFISQVDSLLWPIYMVTQTLIHSLAWRYGGGGCALLCTALWVGWTARGKSYFSQNGPSPFVAVKTYI